MFGGDGQRRIYWKGRRIIERENLQDHPHRPYQQAEKQINTNS